MRSRMCVLSGVMVSVVVLGLASHALTQEWGVSAVEQEALDRADKLLTRQTRLRKDIQEDVWLKPATPDVEGYMHLSAHRGQFEGQDVYVFEDEVVTVEGGVTTLMTATTYAAVDFDCVHGEKVTTVEGPGSQKTETVTVIREGFVYRVEVARSDGQNAQALLESDGPVLCGFSGARLLGILDHQSGRQYAFRTIAVGDEEAGARIVLDRFRVMGSHPVMLGGKKYKAYTVNEDLGGTWWTDRKGRLLRVLTERGDLMEVCTKEEALEGIPVEEEPVQAEEFDEPIAIDFNTRIVERDDDELEVLVVGTVQNNSSQTLLLLRAGFTFFDDEGHSVEYTDELLAHMLPVGDNRGSVGPGESKGFRLTHDVPTTWDRDTVRMSIMEAQWAP